MTHMDRDDWETHGIALNHVVNVINTYGDFVTADVDSPQEDQAEKALSDLVDKIIEPGTDGWAGHVILTLCSLLVSTADPEVVQKWLDQQGLAITEALGDSPD